MRDARGYPIRDRGVTPFPGLYFCGLHWMSSLKSGLLFGVGETAAHVAGHLCGTRPPDPGDDPGATAVSVRPSRAHRPGAAGRYPVATLNGAGKQTMTRDDPWQTREADYPAGASADERLRFLVNYAVLAPSGHNTQPWLFRVADGALSLYADRRRGLPVVDPEDRALTISCGAALEHLLTALRYFGESGDVAILPEPADPDLLATVRPGARHDPDAHDKALFQAIIRRRTTRRAFAPEPPPETLQTQLREAARAFDVELAVLSDASARERIADLVADGDKRQFADPGFRRELAAWMHSRRADSRDGISLASTGGIDALSPMAAALVRTFDLGRNTAARDRELAEHSPALAVLASADDAPKDWLATGRALSRLLLTGTAEGVTAAYLNQPIEVAALRPELRKAAGVAGLPQLLLRLGRGPAVPPAVRRPVAEVLID